MKTQREILDTMVTLYVVNNRQVIFGDLYATTLGLQKVMEEHCSWDDGSEYVFEVVKDIIKRFDIDNPLA